MNAAKVVNFPVPEAVGETWRTTCDEYGIGYGEDLAGLLFLSQFLSRDVHLSLKGMALGEYPAPVRSAMIALLERLRRDTDALFGGESGPDGPTPETNDRPARKPPVGKGK